MKSKIELVLGFLFKPDAQKSRNHQYFEFMMSELSQRAPEFENTLDWFVSEAQKGSLLTQRGVLEIFKKRHHKHYIASVRKRLVLDYFERTGKRRVEA